MEKEFDVKEILAIIGALLIGVILLVTILVNGKRMPDDQVQEWKSVCDNIKPPPFFGTKYDRSSTKPNIALRSIQYSSTASAEEVDEYYVNLLTHSGWNYRKDSNILRFKKGKYSINITDENFSFVTNKIYLVSCSVGLD